MNPKTTDRPATSWTVLSADQALSLICPDERFDGTSAVSLNRFLASVAQWIEHGLSNPVVVGSIPTGGTTRTLRFT